MSKVAIVTDSNSGITQAMAKEMNISVIPMPFIFGEEEETYFEDINLTQDEFYKKLETGVDVKTSQPSLEYVLNLWDGLLKEYDEIVHIPMSSGLSSSCSTAIMLASDYEGKVQVVNNQRISVTQYQSVLDAIQLVKAGKSAAEIKQILEETKYDSSIYITLETLKYLKKGGRITPAAAAIGTLLKIKPVLQIQGEKLDAFTKVRTMKQAKTAMINAVKKDLTDRFGTDELGTGFYIQIAHTYNDEMALELKEELEAIFPNRIGEIIVHPLSLSVSCHIGPGALAMACTKVLDMEKYS